MIHEPTIWEATWFSARRVQAKKLSHAECMFFRFRDDPPKYPSEAKHNITNPVRNATLTIQNPTISIAIFWRDFSMASSKGNSSSRASAPRAFTSCWLVVARWPTTDPWHRVEIVSKWCFWLVMLCHVYFSMFQLFNVNHVIPCSTLARISRHTK